jgi:hypothetical protein
MDGNDETEVLDTTEEEVEGQAPVEEQEQEGQEEQQDGSEGEQAEETSDEVVVTIGDEPAAEEEPPEAAAKWVKELRKKHQETAKENRELRKELDALKTKPANEEALGEKPTLESCEYDAEVFEQKLEAWHEKKRAHDERERKKQEEGSKAQAAWQATLDNYGKRKSELKVSDYEEAEETAKEILNVTQQGVIVSGADNPAVVVYALGKNPKKARELAAITDPVKFAFAVAKLEKDMKVTPKRTAPMPESTVRGSAPVAGAAATLERLREEARRTGDYSKVTEFNRKQAAKKSGA